MKGTYQFNSTQATSTSSSVGSYSLFQSEGAGDDSQTTLIKLKGADCTKFSIPGPVEVKGGPEPLFLSCCVTSCDAFSIRQALAIDTQIEGSKW
jgi:hypothetical protein